MKRPGRSLLRLASQLHRRVYELSGGKVGGRVGEAAVLLLTTTGRKTGRPRTTPLLFLPDGSDVVVVASYGGAPAHPAWFLNLEASPDVEVQMERERRLVRARRATPEERERLWPQLVSIYKGYESYQRKTAREIPVVILARRSQPSPGGRTGSPVATTGRPSTE